MCYFALCLCSLHQDKVTLRSVIIIIIAKHHAICRYVLQRCATLHTVLPTRHAWYALYILATPIATAFSRPHWLKCRYGASLDRALLRAWRTCAAPFARPRAARAALARAALAGVPCASRTSTGCKAAQARPEAALGTVTRREALEGTSARPPRRPSGAADRAPRRGRLRSRPSWVRRSRSGAQAGARQGPRQPCA